MEVNLNIIVLVLGFVIYYSYKAKQSRMKWEAYYRALKVSEYVVVPESYQTDEEDDDEELEDEEDQSDDILENRTFACPCVDEDYECDRCQDTLTLYWDELTDAERTEEIRKYNLQELAKDDSDDLFEKSNVVDFRKKP